MSSKKLYWVIECVLSFFIIACLFLSGLCYANKAFVILWGGMAIFASIVIIVRAILLYLRKIYSVSFIVLFLALTIWNEEFIDGICYIPTDRSQFFQVILPLMISASLAICIFFVSFFLTLKKRKSDNKSKARILVISLLVWFFVLFLVFSAMETFVEYVFYPPKAENIEVVIVNATDNLNRGDWGESYRREYIVAYLGKNENISVQSIYIQDEKYGINVGDIVNIRYYFGPWGGSYKVLY